MNETASVETETQDATQDVLALSPRLAVVCVILAAVLAGWFAQWLLAGGSSKPLAHAPLNTLKQRASANGDEPQQAVIQMMQQQLPGEPLATNPLGLPSPAHVGEPLRFQRADGPWLEEVAIFKTTETPNPERGILLTWQNSLHDQGWNGPLIASETDPRQTQTLRYDRGPREYLWIRYRPTDDRYHDLLLAYRKTTLQDPTHGDVKPDGDR